MEALDTKFHGALVLDTRTLGRFLFVSRRPLGVISVIDLQNAFLCLFPIVALQSEGLIWLLARGPSNKIASSFGP